MAPVEHEFFRCETGFARGGVKKTRSFSQLVPARSRMNIDLDNPRVGSDAKKLEARIARRFVAFEQDRLVHCFGGGFDGSDELEIIFQGVDRRHEDIENAVSRLNAHGRARDPRSTFMAARHPIGVAANIFAAWALCCRSAYGSRRFELKVKLRIARQGRKLLREIRRKGGSDIAWASPRLRIEGQPVAHGRISGNKITTIGAQKPASAAPMSRPQIARHRQRIANDLR